MIPEPNGLQRVQSLINDAADVTVIVLFLVATTIFFVPNVQSRWTYAGAAIGMGILGGVFIRWMNWPEGFVIIASMAGVIAGPVTILKAQGKDVFEIIEEIRKARRSGGDGDET